MNETEIKAYLEKVNFRKTESKSENCLRCNKSDEIANEICCNKNTKIRLPKYLAKQRVCNRFFIF